MYKDKEVIFIGTYAGKNYLKKLLSNKQYDQLAANQTEGHYIYGLGNIVKKIYVFSALVMPSYPKSPYKIIHSNHEEIRYGDVENIRFINLPGIRFISQMIEFYRAINKWSKQSNDGDNDKLIIVYAMRLPFYVAATYVKKLYPKATCINIVPDLPIYMHMEDASFIRRIKSRINQIVLLRISNIFDGFVLYTKDMRKILGCDKKNSIVIEGIVSSCKNYTSVEHHVRNKQIIMYAGGLNYRYGVKTLAEGFLLANLPNTELHFYGAGDYAEDLKRLCEKNTSIKYFGLLSPEQVKQRMGYASLLVNPRPTNEEFTKYSCPSKTLEYMASGVPFLSTRLGGIPEDYYRYIYTIDDESVLGIADALKKVFNDPLENRIKKGLEAKKYILSEKNEKIQAEKLISFANSLK